MDNESKLYVANQYPIYALMMIIVDSNQLTKYTIYRKMCLFFHNINNEKKICCNVRHEYNLKRFIQIHLTFIVSIIYLLEVLHYKQRLYDKIELKEHHQVNVLQNGYYGLNETERWTYSVTKEVINSSVPNGSVSLEWDILSLVSWWDNISTWLYGLLIKLENIVKYLDIYSYSIEIYMIR